MKANTRLDEAEGRIEKVEDHFQNRKEVITAMLKLHGKLQNKLLDFESRSWHENVRIYGMPEGAEKESTTINTSVALHEGLKLTEDVPDLNIERAHWSVGPQLLMDVDEGFTPADRLEL